MTRVGLFVSRSSSDMCRMLHQQPSRGGLARRRIGLAGRLARPRVEDQSARLSAAESRLVAEALAGAGDVLIRKAVSVQPGGGPVFDGLMIAGQELSVETFLRRDSELRTAAVVLRGADPQLHTVSAARLLVGGALDKVAAPR